MISIDWLTSWFEANRAILAAHEIEYSILVRNSNTDNPAQAYDIDSKRYVARVTLWESGDCNFEALEIGKDSFGVNEHRKITSTDDLHDFLMPLIPLL